VARRGSALPDSKVRIDVPLTRAESASCFVTNREGRGLRAIVRDLSKFDDGPCGHLPLYLNPLLCYGSNPIDSKKSYKNIKNPDSQNTENTTGNSHNPKPKKTENKSKNISERFELRLAFNSVSLSLFDEKIHAISAHTKTIEITIVPITATSMGFISVPSS
jgi:hypothetical protein